MNQFYGIKGIVRRLLSKGVMCLVLGSPIVTNTIFSLQGHAKLMNLSLKNAAI